MKKEEILDQFFKGEITQSELKGYVDRGDIDDTDVQSFGHLTTALEEKDVNETRQFLNDLNDQNDSQSPRNWKTIMVTLLGILILSASLIYFFSKEEETVSPKANLDVTQFAYLYPSDTNTRSSEDTSINVDKVSAQAQTYYANSDYDNHMKYYEEHKELLSATESSQLQYVSSLIALKKYEKVLKIGGEINCETIECTQNLEWYSIISLIATDQAEKAKRMLENIGKDSNHIFYSDAERLNKELKN
jgi:hypothetical protein